MAPDTQTQTTRNTSNWWALVALAAIAIAAGVWALVSRSPGPEVRLVPAWQLLDPGRYRALQMSDPFVSWSPDSRSLIFSVGYFDSPKAEVMSWEVGGKALSVVTDGSSPSYIDGSRMLYLKGDPARPFVRDLASGEDAPALRKLAALPEWKEVRAIEYDRESKAVITRLVEYTERRIRGTDIYDLEGNHLGDVRMELYGPMLETAEQPGGQSHATISAEQGECVLRIGPRPAEGDAILRSRYLGAMDWSPDGKLLAVGDEASVVIVDPNNGRSVVVGRFAPPEDSSEERYVARVRWSPNGDYLALMVYVSGGGRDYALVNVLDLSRSVFD